MVMKYLATLHYISITDDDDVTDATEEEPEWEKELAAELNEFEIVIDENTGTILI